MRPENLYLLLEPFWYEDKHYLESDLYFTLLILWERNIRTFMDGSSEWFDVAGYINIWIVSCILSQRDSRNHCFGGIYSGWPSRRSKVICQSVWQLPYLGAIKFNFDGVSLRNPDYEVLMDYLLMVVTQKLRTSLGNIEKRTDLKRLIALIPWQRSWENELSEWNGLSKNRTTLYDSPFKKIK